MGNSTLRIAANAPMCLGQCADFEHLPAPAVKLLEDRSPRRDAPIGEVILSAESPAPHGVYVILQGAVRVFRTTRFGTQVRVGEFRAGEMFGELGAIDGNSGSATVQAIEHTVLAQIPREQFRVLLETQPTFALHVMKRMVDLLRILDERIVAIEDLHDALHEEFKKLLISTL
jgi:CRP/FNR family transcriptional regulator